MDTWFSKKKNLSEMRIFNVFYLTVLLNKIISLYFIIYFNNLSKLFFLNSLACNLQKDRILSLKGKYVFIE